MSTFEKCLLTLTAQPKKWIVTGAAGFIGSHLVEQLLHAKQTVIGLDNFSSGTKENIALIEKSVSVKAWKNFTLVPGDIRDFSLCQRLCSEGRVDHVLHQAALSSVTHSIKDPLRVNDNNITGFLHMLLAARDSKATFVYASSCAVYGNESTKQQKENCLCSPLSPYALSKLVNEQYAKIFAQAYGYKSIGLRYFNIFGPRQDPHGGYAAVIPQWYKNLMLGHSIYINGDGTTTRDFCYIADCVQANILASCTTNPEAFGHVYNIALGKETTLASLFQLIQADAQKKTPSLLSARIKKTQPIHRDFRVGDVHTSCADITKAQKVLGYAPRFSIEQGLDKTGEWSMQQKSKKQ